MMRSRRSRLQEQEREVERAEETVAALHDDSRRYREALDALPVGVVIRDDDDREAYRNGRAASPTGDLQADVLVARALDALFRLPRDERPHHETVTWRGPPARSVDVSVDSLPSGGAIGLVADVTERHQIDSVRRDFVANVNHELRTPIGALGLLAETLEAERDPEVIRRLVARMSAEAERAHELLEDLLDLSRIETGDRPAPEPVVMTDLVERALRRVDAALERSGVAISVERLDDAQVDGIREDLVSAVANLLDNALKYSERGSTVRVQVRAASGVVEVEVRDEGIGIAAKELDRIFERFYRVDRARDRRTGGSGLGLAIVRHVATNHGGEVQVRSVEGEGSTFTITLRSAS
jgi:two-component system sensor histidine kinase SenX3